MEKEIKICDGFRVIYDGEEIIMDTLSEVFEAIHWGGDDPETQEARTIFVKNMWCFGYVDLTMAMPKGHTLIIHAIPCKD